MKNVLIIKLLLTVDQNFQTFLKIYIGFTASLFMNPVNLITHLLYHILINLFKFKILILIASYSSLKYSKTVNLFYFQILKLVNPCLSQKVLCNKLFFTVYPFICLMESVIRSDIVNNHCGWCLIKILNC